MLLLDKGFKKIKAALSSFSNCLKTFHEPRSSRSFETFSGYISTISISPSLSYLPSQLACIMKVGDKLGPFDPVRAT